MITSRTWLNDPHAAVSRQGGGSAKSPLRASGKLRKGLGNKIGTRLLCWSYRESQFRTGVPWRGGCSERDRTAGPNDELTDDGKAKASTARAAASCVIEPGKALEDPFPIFRSDAWAVVADADHSLTVIKAGSHLDLGTRVPHRVVDQIS